MEINDRSLIILQNIHYEYFKIDFEKAYGHGLEFLGKALGTNGRCGCGDVRESCIPSSIMVAYGLRTRF